MINPKTGLSKGFGFVSYDTADAVDEAITSMNGFRVCAKLYNNYHLNNLCKAILCFTLHIAR